MIIWLNSRNLQAFKCVDRRDEYLSRLERINKESIFSADTLYILAYNQELLQDKTFYDDISYADFLKARCEMYIKGGNEEAVKVFASYVNNCAVMQGITIDLNAVITSAHVTEKLSADNRVEPKDGVLAIPDSINNIEQEAYLGNQDIQKLMCGENLWYIGVSAFRNNAKLTDIEFSKTLIQIGQYAFAYSGIQRAKFPGSLRSIDNYAFAGCSNLEDIVLNDGLEVIDAYAFNSCSRLKTLTIPLSVEHIYTGAFSQCYGLEEVAPLHTKYLESHVFFACRALKKIEFTSDVEKIGNYILQECSAIEEVKISSSIEDIGHEAFIGLPKNTKFIIKVDSDMATSIVPLRLYQMDLTFDVER